MILAYWIEFTCDKRREVSVWYHSLLSSKDLLLLVRLMFLCWGEVVSSVIDRPTWSEVLTVSIWVKDMFRCLSSCDCLILLRKFVWDYRAVFSALPSPKNKVSVAWRATDTAWASWAIFLMLWSPFAVRFSSSSWSSSSSIFSSSSFSSSESSAAAPYASVKN